METHPYVGALTHDDAAMARVFRFMHGGDGVQARDAAHAPGDREEQLPLVFIFT